MQADVSPLALLLFLGETWPTTCLCSLESVSALVPPVRSLDVVVVDVAEDA